PGADRAAFDRMIGNYMRSYVTGYAQTESGSKGTFSIHLGEMPLADIHLHSDRTDELEVNGNVQYVYIFSAIAVLVLVIACINFINLSTARSAKRAREVGVRKVLGSGRGGLIAQFLFESLFLTAAAAILAFGFTALLLPAFDRLTGKDLALSATTIRWLLPALVGITAVAGLGAGVWPAFFLSAFRPVKMLKGQLSLRGKAGGFRNVLVVFQFSISVFLMVGTLVIYRQLNYIQSKDLGFSRSQVLVVKNLDALAGPPGAPAVTPALSSLKDEVSGWTGVSGATQTSFLPTAPRRWHNFGLSKKNPVSLQTELWEVDENYVPTMRMQIVTGRNFSRNFATDSTAVILNQTAAKEFGIAADPLGQPILYPHYWHPTKFHVIGVVKDFNFNSVRSEVKPLVLIDRPDYTPWLAIRIRPGYISTVLAQIKNKWPALNAHRPFEYSFMDEDFDAIYRAEQRMGRVVIVLTGLAILIACLGLFGLAAYTAEQRTKEIGIRRVLGASVTSIITLLSKDFARLIAIAILIAAPLSWIAASRWLQDFAYRTTITPWSFVIAATIVIVLALSTTLFQSFKTAFLNPADTLHTE
ncbi:MAG TPA: FtsX-like permease family protein, partial [Puia sp.]|nr:FtsX-like permease family protein [Puia sp.]